MTKKVHLTFSQVVKLFTAVPHKFIDDFYQFYLDDTYDEYIVDLDKLAEWLDVPKYELLKTLRRSYQKDIDFVVKSAPRKAKDQRYGGNRHVQVMITLDCMKRLCMRSRSAMAETVRSYFIEIEEFQMKYNDQIVDGLMKDIQDMARQDQARFTNDGPGVIYIIRASKENSSLYKIGHTKDLYHRLSTYNTGRVDDVELLSIYKTPYRKEVEKCVKRLMKEKQYKSRREIYHVDWSIIQKLIMGCSQFSMKLHKTSRKNSLDGEYYLIFTSDLDKK